MVQTWCFICLAVRRPVVVLARKIHLCRKRLGRSGGQLTPSCVRIHAVAISRVALLLRAEVVCDRVGSWTVMTAGKVGETLADSMIITCHNCLLGYAQLLLLSILAHRTIYWLQVWQLIRGHASIVHFFDTGGLLEDGALLGPGALNDRLRILLHLVDGLATKLSH